MSSMVITLDLEGRTEAVLEQLYKLPSGNVKEQAHALAGLFRSIACGDMRASYRVQISGTNPVAASATATLVSAAAADAITIGGVALTASSTPANENEWEIDGASDALDAASLAACINAHSTVSTLVTAVAESNVVTITAKQAGIVGNEITLTDTGTTITVTGSGYLAGGTGGVDEAGTLYSAGI